MHNTEDDVFGTDEEFERRLKEFKDRCRKRCCNFLSKFVKHKVGIIVLILSIVTFGVGVSVCLFNVFTGAPTVIYSLTALCCSVISMRYKKGHMLEEKAPESRRLLTSSGGQKKSSHLSLEHVMEPRQRSGIFEARSPYQGAYEVDRSFICEPLNSDDCSPGPSHAKSHPRLIYGEGSVGTSSTPDPFPTQDYDDKAAGAPGTTHKASGLSDSADVTSSRSFEDVTYSFVPPESIETSDLEESSEGLSAARLSAHGIRTFGAPSNVYGAQKYIVYQSSDENTFGSSTSSDQPKTFEVSVEVHPVAHRQMSSSNDGSSFGEPTSIASDETKISGVSDHGGSSRQIISSNSGEPASMASDEAAKSPVSDHGDSSRQIDSISSGERASVAIDEGAKSPVSDHDDSSRQIISINSGEPAAMASDEGAKSPVSDHGDSSTQMDSSISGEPAAMASDETCKKPVFNLPDIIVNPLHINKGKSVFVSVEIHPDSTTPIGASSSDSSLGERVSRESEETALTPDSDHDMPYIDDDSP